MHGPPLSPREVRYYLRRRYGYLRRAGLSHDTALEAMSRDDKIDLVKLRVLLPESEPLI